MARTQPAWEITYSLCKLANLLDAQGHVQAGAQQAAAVYASISPPYPEVVDSLNRKAGNHLPNYRDLAGVANQLAGTTNLEAQDALSNLAGN